MTFNVTLVYLKSRGRRKGRKGMNKTDIFKSSGIYLSTLKPSHKRTKGSGQRDQLGHA